MKLENKELIQKFYNQEKEKYPGLTFEQFYDICSGPWRFLKREMESGELPEVRLKYFGTFQVYEGRAKNMLHSIENRFKFHKIAPKQYFKLKEMLSNYLKRKEDEKNKTNN